MRLRARVKFLGCLIVATAFAATLATSRPVFAVVFNGARFQYYSCSGAQCGTPVYGAAADIWHGSSSFIPTGTCVIFSATLSTPGGNQVQAGKYACAGSSVGGAGGTCPAPPSGWNHFVELYNGGTYSCYAHGYSQAGSAYSTQYLVQYNGATWFYGYIGGYPYEATQSLDLNQNRSYTWAEYGRSGSQGCPSASATWTTMYWRNAAGAWNYVYPATPYADGNFTCWSAYGQTGVGGWYGVS